MKKEKILEEISEILGKPKDKLGYSEKEKNEINRLWKLIKNEKRKR